MTAPRRIAVALAATLAGCATDDARPGRMVIFENGRVCAEPVESASVAEASDGAPFEAPPVALLSRGGFLVCRAHQKDRIDAGTYALALRSAAPSMLMMAASRTAFALGALPAPLSRWPSRSPFVRAACLGLADDPAPLPDSISYCHQYFP